MITAKAIRNRIAEICSAVTWEYKGKPCGVDPCGIPIKKVTENTYEMRYSFDMWYGDKNADFSSVDEVMNEPFFDGKTIEEIIPDMVDYDEG